MNENERQHIGELQEYLKALESCGNFHIEPLNTTLNFNNEDDFTKLKLTQNQRMRISAFMQQVPLAVATGAMANAYAVRFPAGLPHTLTALGQGGFGSMIRDGGKIVGHASFYPMIAQAAVMGVFTVLAAITGQFFLTQITKELKMMNQKIDEIIEFLREDKRSELRSEIIFVQGAYRDYSSIMEHEKQRLATIISLQSARKVAMKDIEFYFNHVNDLGTKVIHANVGSNGQYIDWIGKLKQLIEDQESLEWSKQLLAMSGVLEVYYSQNNDSEYLDAMKEELCAYISMCEKCTTGYIRALVPKIKSLEKRANDGFVSEYKHTYEHCAQKASEFAEADMKPGKSTVSKTIEHLLSPQTSSTEYYLCSGNVYLPKQGSLLQHNYVRQIGNTGL